MYSETATATEGFLLASVAQTLFDGEKDHVYTYAGSFPEAGLIELTVPDETTGKDMVFHLALRQVKV